MQAEREWQRIRLLPGKVRRSGDIVIAAFEKSAASSPAPSSARLAQTRYERWSYKPEAAGSQSALGTKFGSVV